MGPGVRRDDVGYFISNAKAPFQKRRVGKGALCAVPTTCLDPCDEWWARFALPTLRKFLSRYFVSSAKAPFQSSGGGFS
jgi:hypothetical protein